MPCLNVALHTSCLPRRQACAPLTDVFSAFFASSLCYPQISNAPGVSIAECDDPSDEDEDGLAVAQCVGEDLPAGGRFVGFPTLVRILMDLLVHPGGR